MLRYFYILVCIQLSICYDYIENNNERRARCKFMKEHKKNAATTRKSRTVRFDVANFMQKPFSVNNYEPYVYRNSKRENRRELENYDDHDSLVGSSEQVKTKYKAMDYSNLNDNMISGLHTKMSSVDEINPRHFNLHSMSFDEKTDVKSIHGHKKSTRSLLEITTTEKYNNHPEKKCAYKNMKVPFFSFNKSTSKTKRQKRRKFCFNCNQKTSTTHEPQGEYIFSQDDLPKDSNTFNNGYENTRLNKRAYQELCPKCIKELLSNLRKKPNKKVKHSSSTKLYHKSTKAVFKKKTTAMDKVDNIDDSLGDLYDFASGSRKKRFNNEEIEKDRRLKELEEVEKKIDEVRITAPTFSKVSLNMFRNY